MSRRLVLITRPAEDSGPLVVALGSMGYGTLLAPMLDISLIVPPPKIPLSGVQAFLITSANGARVLAAALKGGRDLRVFAVGEASAEVTRALGFTAVEAAGGDVVALAALVAARCDPTAGRLIHAAGSVVARDLQAMLETKGFAVERVVFYDAAPARALPSNVATALKGGRLDAVLFFSPRTAKTFVTLTKEFGCAAAATGLTAVCLSAAVAEAAQALQWRRVVIAARPVQAALIEALAGVLSNQS